MGWGFFSAYCGHNASSTYMYTELMFMEIRTAFESVMCKSFVPLISLCFSETILLIILIYSMKTAKKVLKWLVYFMLYVGEHLLNWSGMKVYFFVSFSLFLLCVCLHYWLIL